MQTQNQEQVKGFLGLSYEELLFMVDALNGVKITIETEYEWNTFAQNVESHEEFREPIQGLKYKVRALNFNESTALYYLIKEFWNAPGYNIPNTKARMVQVGLLKKS